jgi:hypothetical protein
VTDLLIRSAGDGDDDQAGHAESCTSEEDLPEEGERADRNDGSGHDRAHAAGVHLEPGGQAQAGDHLLKQGRPMPDMPAKNQAGCGDAEGDAGPEHVEVQSLGDVDGHDRHRGGVGWPASK